MENLCTVLVCSCDGYEDTWVPFFELFQKYWNDCPFSVILNTESKTYSVPGLDIITYQFYEAGEKVSYGERVLRHLEKIETPFVLILMDDFFIRSKVNTEEIMYCISELEKNPDIAGFSFDSIRDEMNVDDGMYENYVLRPKCGEYKINLQGGCGGSLFWPHLQERMSHHGNLK